MHAVQASPEHGLQMGCADAQSSHRFVLMWSDACGLWGRPSAEALRELAADLGAKYGTTDRERAASMLSSLTIFLEHHQALLDAGIFPALMAAVLDASAVPQASLPSLPLSCAA